jgi:hypothetical protein
MVRSRVVGTLRGSRRRSILAGTIRTLPAPGGSGKRRICPTLIKFFDIPPVVPLQDDALAPRYNAGYTPEYEDCDLDT